MTSRDIDVQLPDQEVEVNVSCQLRYVTIAIEEDKLTVSMTKGAAISTTVHPVCTINAFQTRIISMTTTSFFVAIQIVFPCRQCIGLLLGNQS